MNKVRSIRRGEIFEYQFGSHAILNNEILCILIKHIMNILAGYAHVATADTLLLKFKHQ